MQDKIAAVKDKEKDIKQEDKVKLFVCDSINDENLIFTSGTIMANEVIKLVGGVNVCEKILNKAWGRVFAEVLIDANPDYIIFLDYGSTPVEDKNGGGCVYKLCYLYGEKFSGDTYCVILAMGSIATASWNNFILPTIVVLIGMLYFIFESNILNALLLGEENALNLGVNVKEVRKKYLVITSLITGILVSVTGTIGFVGLVVPHVVRIIVGSDNKRVLLCSAIIGAEFLIW